MTDLRPEFRSPSFGDKKPEQVDQKRADVEEDPDKHFESDTNQSIDKTNTGEPPQDQAKFRLGMPAAEPGEPPQDQAKFRLGMPAAEPKVSSQHSRSGSQSHTWRSKSRNKIASRSSSRSASPLRENGQGVDDSEPNTCARVSSCARQYAGVRRLEAWKSFQYAIEIPFIITFVIIAAIVIFAFIEHLLVWSARFFNKPQLQHMQKELLDGYAILDTQR